MELVMGIEPMASPLPRGCSTTELHQHEPARVLHAESWSWSAMRAEGGVERAKGIEPSCAAWKAAVLPLNYARK